MTDSAIRLNKYISESGICSRRDADRFIEQGNVFINGKRAQVGDQVSFGDKVKVNGQDIEPRDAEDLVFIALNKPVGIVSTTEGTERDNIVDFVNHSTRIFPIGRLDKDSQGLIFLTNNGDLVNKILRAGNNHDKEYVVTVNKPITDDFIKGMGAGVPILGVVTKKCKVEQVSTYAFKIVLVQGLNRQIRRMCEYFGFEVTKLERQQIMNVSLKGLPIGEWRDLDKQELDVLFDMIKDSSSEDKKSAPKKKPKPKPKTQSLRDKIEGPEHFMQHNRSSKHKGQAKGGGKGQTKGQAKGKGNAKGGKGKPSASRKPKR
ncbi:23S rRNA pseudouridine synthase F [Shewanella sp. UCD-FRSSP16_17]|uniref:23S rRNA pseudouridine(2604) synthase RluF n=1 Tax=unclassified Shewanella TaxID=196818 RepID=UPI0007EEB855|nr:23S rRNA pseudouridine(2604) synthase RluF [Shewanella sp. UCD-FRSSP16_17]MBQ4889570.1 23S rRNA pseudouridine(2604) synthase RluF [Shewanella sp. MMG014]OBT08325.1 23S rRNA pseudouridine synthase F [Shewanella sp. UCD-FRSSP16_17]